MKTYVLLLRGINVSGYKIIKMSDLEKSISSLSFKNVITYLQSGNVVFESEIIDSVLLQNQIHDKIKSDFGFDVPTFVIHKDDFFLINKNNPFTDNPNFDSKKIHIIFLKKVPSQSIFQEIERNPNNTEKMACIKNVIYMYYENGYGKTKLHNNFFENKLDVIATTRNLNTVTKLESLMRTLK